MRLAKEAVVTIEIKVGIAGYKKVKPKRNDGPTRMKFSIENYNSKNQPFLATFCPF